jgi:hypothetical protein
MIVGLVLAGVDAGVSRAQSIQVVGGSSRAPGPGDWMNPENAIARTSPPIAPDGMFATSSGLSSRQSYLGFTPVAGQEPIVYPPGAQITYFNVSGRMAELEGGYFEGTFPNRVHCSHLLTVTLVLSDGTESRPQQWAKLNTGRNPSFGGGPTEWGFSRTWTGADFGSNFAVRFEETTDPDPTYAQCPDKHARLDFFDLDFKYIATGGATPAPGFPTPPPPLGTPLPPCSASAPCFILPQCGGGGTVTVMTHVLQPTTLQVQVDDPQSAQVVTVAGSLPAWANLNVTAGNPATGTLTITPGLFDWVGGFFGFGVIGATLEATDNGSPAQTTTCRLSIRVNLL